VVRRGKQAALRTLDNCSRSQLERGSASFSMGVIGCVGGEDTICGHQIRRRLEFSNHEGKRSCKLREFRLFFWKVGA